MQKLESTALCIWRVTDGKRGHYRQSQGLVEALKGLVQVKVIDVPCLSFWRALWHLLAGRHLSIDESPDLLVGAGHATHMTLVAFGKLTGAKTVVLMKPSLPCHWFDLCIIPKHDDARGKNILVTEGALNAMAMLAKDSKHHNSGLILIGGPSQHYQWDSHKIIAQIKLLTEATDYCTWVLSTSRRTPANFLELLYQQVSTQHLEIAPYHAVNEDWLPDQLAQAEVVWLSPDSVSMLYEALTAGCSVGVFDLEAKPASAIVQSTHELILQHKIVRFSDWQSKQHMPAANTTFNEALRCAQWIKSNWFPNH